MMMSMMASMCITIILSSRTMLISTILITTIISTDHYYHDQVTAKINRKQLAENERYSRVLVNKVLRVLTYVSHYSYLHIYL